jgi:UDP-GlcNAc:undecaprenyl-phosphate GlcNAc-1-phosphate transferase
VNLIDGLDGLAAGIAVIAASFFLLVGVKLGDGAVVVVSLGLIGALLAFLRFNFHPALIFMGDTGSMFIGFTLAFLACLLAPQVGSWQALLGGATVLGVPVLDTTTAICRRLLTGQHIFHADGEHIHHKLLRLGLSHRRAVLVLYGLQFVLAGLGAGILLGQLRLFPLALALGAAFSLGIAAWSHRHVAHPALKQSEEPLPLLADEPAQGTLLPPRPATPRGPSQRPTNPAEVYAEVPPAPPSRPS